MGSDGMADFNKLTQPQQDPMEVARQIVEQCPPDVLEHHIAQAILTERQKAQADYRGAQQRRIELQQAELADLRQVVQGLSEENEKLKNRVNLLSVSANRIRDAYDNGLVADLTAKLSVAREALNNIKRTIEKESDEAELMVTWQLASQALAQIEGANPNDNDG